MTTCTTTPFRVTYGMALACPRDIKRLRREQSEFTGRSKSGKHAFALQALKAKCMALDMIAAQSSFGFAS